jgi:hypothetical protein
MLTGAGRAPFASFTLAFALQLRKKHGKTSVRVIKTSEYSIHITKTPTHYVTFTHTHTHARSRARTHMQTHCAHTLQNPHIHTNTLQNNIKPPQDKLKQTTRSMKCKDKHVVHPGMFSWHLPPSRGYVTQLYRA